MRTVLTDLDLSMIVSVPTSRRPTDVGSTLYLRIKLETTNEEKKNPPLATWCTGGVTPHTGERHGVDILSVVCERHVGLAEANGIFALGNTVIDLELLFGNALDERVRKTAR